jgi:hypothetical protein
MALLGSQLVQVFLYQLITFTVLVRHKNRIETKTKQKNINTALSSFLFTGLY